MKRLVASALVLTLTASMATVVFASNPQGADSDAAIEFVPGEGGEGPGIIDPGEEDDRNPQLPWDPGHNVLSSINLDFHTRDLPQLDITYRSWYTNPSVPNAVPYWSSTRGWQDRAGIAVVTHRNTWTVQVGIGHFINSNSPHPQNHTLLGYDLRLIPHGPAFIGSANATFNFTGPTGNLNPGSGAATVATGTMGFTGGNWEGELDVLGFSAHTGQAQADLTWTFVAGP